MASQFQQQTFNRKLLYIALIIGLFTVSMIWRGVAINPLAKDLAIREEERGEVELVGSVVRLGLTGSRGLVLCVLWNNAIDKQKKNQWNSLEVLVRAITKLQPHFITPWLFQSWNLAYNVSVESDRVRDKYFYVSRGVELLAQGERQNKNHPDLRWSIGFYTQHKICQSDETNYLRSLFQLSMVPPSQRDPARFYKVSETQGENKEQAPEFNWDEFIKFCEENPQLMRRLKEGMHRDNEREKRRQFVCATPEDVVAFLEENYNVPSIYQVPALPAGQQAYSRRWQSDTKNVLLDAESRFPVLPPAHTPAFDPTALDDKRQLGDRNDAFSIAHAWYCYAQEPIPEPDEMPGSTKPIVNRAKNRRPRNITTLIFRNYPAQGRRYMAERLQQEGWFDEEGWNVTDWLTDNRATFPPGKQEIRVGTGEKWSLDAWRAAAAAWEEHGKLNHLILDPAREQNYKDLAARFTSRYPAGSPNQIRPEYLSEEEKKEFFAWSFLNEYAFYRQVSNFAHHLIRSQMEARPETVACRKLFYVADSLHLSGSPRPALDLYRTPITVKDVDDWKETKRSPLDAWRDLVLMANAEFRRDSFIQEQSAEIQIRYMLLANRIEGPDLKRKFVAAAPLVPLLPKLAPEDVRPWITTGPYDQVITKKGEPDDGKPLVDPGIVQSVLERMNLVQRKPIGPLLGPDGKPTGPQQQMTPDARPVAPDSKGKL